MGGLVSPGDAWDTQDTVLHHAVPASVLILYIDRYTRCYSSSICIPSWEFYIPRLWLDCQICGLDPPAVLLPHLSARIYMNCMPRTTYQGSMGWQVHGWMHVPYSMLHAAVLVIKYWLAETKNRALPHTWS